MIKTKSLPIRSSGLYHCLMPEIIFRIPSSPKSIVNRSSLSEPSFSSQRSTRPMRRSILEKSSYVMMGFMQIFYHKGNQGDRGDQDLLY